MVALIFFLFVLVSEHYQGNRFRNQVVRQDFPKALNEQIKERDEAARKAELYYQMMREQEEADKKIAYELTEKLKHDQENERRRNAHQSEILAQKMQKDLILKTVEPIVNELPIPPKKIGSKINGYKPISREISHPSTSMSTSPPPHEQQLNYVSLDLNMSKSNSSQRLMVHTPTQYTQVLAQHSPVGASTDGSEHHYEHINLHSHTPEKKAPPTNLSYAECDYSFPSTSSHNIPLPPRPSKPPMSPSKYDLPKLPPKHSQSVDPIESGVQKLTTDTFDMLMGNKRLIRREDETDSFVENSVPSNGPVVDRQYLMSHPSANALDHVNDIQNFNDAMESACAVFGNKERIRAMQELGVPADEILEIDRRLTQQEKDEVMFKKKLEKIGLSRFFLYFRNWHVFYKKKKPNR